MGLLLANHFALAVENGDATNSATTVPHSTERMFVCISKLFDLPGEMQAYFAHSPSRPDRI
jgi:hypothetical protein